MTDNAQRAPSVECRILDACPHNTADPNITFEYQGSRIVYRWWSSETEYRTLTRAERRHLERLLDERRLQRVHGWRHGRGYIEGTPGTKAEQDAYLRASVM